MQWVCLALSQAWSPVKYNALVERLRETMPPGARLGRFLDRRQLVDRDHTKGLKLFDVLKPSKDRNGVASVPKTLIIHLSLLKNFVQNESAKREDYTRQPQESHRRIDPRQWCVDGYNCPIMFIHCRTREQEYLSKTTKKKRWTYLDQKLKWNPCEKRGIPKETLNGIREPARQYTCLSTRLSC